MLLTALPAYTQYLVSLGPIRLQPTSSAMFFPLQWARVCLSVDSVDSKVMLVVDGQLVGEEEYNREEDQFRPANISLVLGHDVQTREEYNGQIFDLNIFSSALSQERMIGITIPVTRVSNV